jgi:hypothetical protein
LSAPVAADFVSSAPEQSAISGPSLRPAIYNNTQPALDIRVGNPPASTRDLGFDQRPGESDLQYGARQLRDAQTEKNAADVEEGLGTFEGAVVNLVPDPFGSALGPAIDAASTLPAQDFHSQEQRYRANAAAAAARARGQGAM